MDFKNKRILITAGPTWVPIDQVRVISNIATGGTGIALAKQLCRQGAKVTLLLGPVQACCIDKKIEVVNFRFFDELREKLIAMLSKRAYDAIIHCAAVSDFRPQRMAPGKITSQKSLNLRLIPLPKIIMDIRAYAPFAKLVMFKLEPRSDNASLIQKGRQAQKKAGAEFVVANRLAPYGAFIIDKTGRCISARNRGQLVIKLANLLA